jgi:hypothetical protein
VKKWQRENPERYLAGQRQRRATPKYKRQARDYHLRTKHGITVDEYEALLAEQGGGCAICKRPPRDDISLHVDHDHKTGARRGLLC